MIFIIFVWFWLLLSVNIPKPKHVWLLMSKIISTNSFPHTSYLSWTLWTACMFLAECKINSRRTRKVLFWASFISQQWMYYFTLSVQFYTVISVLFYIWCLILTLACNFTSDGKYICNGTSFVVILHIVWFFTLGVLFYTQCLMLNSV